MLTIAITAVLLGKPLLRALLLEGQVLASDDVKVTCKTRNGFTDVSIFVYRKPGWRLAYEKYIEDRLLVSAMTWNASGSARDIWLTYEFASGPEHENLVVGPTASGKWGVWLRADEANGLRYPPETVSPGRDGIRDVLVLSSAIYKEPGGMSLDLDKSRVQIWRWNEASHAYRLRKVVSYRDRLRIDK